MRAWPKDSLWPVFSFTRAWIMSRNTFPLCVLSAISAKHLSSPCMCIVSLSWQERKEVCSFTRRDLVPFKWMSRGEVWLYMSCTYSLGCKKYFGPFLPSWKLISPKGQFNQPGSAIRQDVLTMPFLTLVYHTRLKSRTHSSWRILPLLFKSSEVFLL